MILFFYNLALFAALLLGAPWWLFRIATTQKYRDGLLQRLGGVPARIRRQEPDSKRPTIWLHAVSVGEVLAVSRLVEELDRTLPGYELMISTTTSTGQQLARARFGSHRVFYCPLDLPWAVRAHLQALRPRLLILAETEFWPNMLSSCFRRGIPVAVVNARVSDRSWPRYRRLRTLWRPFLSRLSLVLAQTELDADRLIAIGCLPGRVTVAGNLKFDVLATAEADATKRLKHSIAGLRIVVAGSTLDGEESLLLEIWPRLLQADSQLVMVLAPRHPERFGAVASMLDSSRVSWFKRSDWPAQQLIKAGDILLLDSIGELASVYSQASIALVGGSLVPAGGHNPLEPAQFGVPTIMGPHYANFRAITDDLLAHDAIRVVAKDDLAEVMIGLLRNSQAAAEMGQRARQVFSLRAGATARCERALRELLVSGSVGEPSQ